MGSNSTTTKLTRNIDSDKPPEWCECIEENLTETSEEYLEAKMHFDRTMKDQYFDLRVIKLINPRTKYFYSKELLTIAKKYKISPQKITMKLFHGTSKTHPKEIYNGHDISFSTKLSSGGLWGIGTYFGTSALYLDERYSYIDKDTHSLLLASVIVGKYFDYKFKANRNLLNPPYIDEVKGIRYDSVKACMMGTDIYVVYSPNREIGRASCRE